MLRSRDDLLAIARAARAVHRSGEGYPPPGEIAGAHRAVRLLGRFERALDDAHEVLCAIVTARLDRAQGVTTLAVGSRWVTLRRMYPATLAVEYHGAALPWIQTWTLLNPEATVSPAVENEWLEGVVRFLAVGQPPPHEPTLVI